MNHRDKLVQFYLNQNNSDKDSAVNIVDHPEEGNLKECKQLSSPEEFPAGEMQDGVHTGPEFSQFKTPRQAEYGQSLTDLATDKHQVKLKQNLTEPFRWNESYHNVNTNEDVDLKLGEPDTDDTDPLSSAVYPPYTDGIGQPNPRYEDVSKKQRNVIVHAEEKESINKGPNYFWVAVDLDGTILEPPPHGIYQDQSGRHKFGQPIEGAKEALQELIDRGARVSIYTARQYFMEDESQDIDLQVAIESQLDQYDIPYTDVYVGRKPPTHYTIDDKAVRFTDWDSALDAVRVKLDKKAQEDFGMHDIELIYEYYYKMSKLFDKKVEEGLTEQGQVILKEMRGLLKSLLQKAIKFLRRVYDQWLSTKGTEAQDRETVAKIKSIAEKLVPSGDVDKDLALFSAALNIVHQTGSMAQYVERWYGIDSLALEGLSLGDRYTERWDQDIRRIAEDDKVKEQKNYKGIKIDIEWPKGSIRSYKGNDTYVTHMRCDYGYAAGVEGADQDSLDVYLGDGDSDVAFIIEQLKEDGSYDEDKVMLGFNTEIEAADMYLQHMPGYMLGEIREVPVDKLVNTLYGEPEDRRGQDDLIPSEEITKEAFIRLAAYSDYAIMLLDQVDPNELASVFKGVNFTKDRSETVNQMVRALLTDRNIVKSLEGRYGPIEPRRPVEKETFKERPSLRWQGLIDPHKTVKMGDIFKPKINKKTKSDYVGPSTSQVGGIGGAGATADDEKEESDPKSHRLLSYRDLGGGGKDGEDKILFVYGTLREMEPNFHRFMENAEFLGEAKTEKRYNLIVSNDSPGLTTGKSAVEGELYLVPKDDIKKIDDYEKPYKRDFVWLDGHQLAHAYFLPEDSDVVESAPRLDSDKGSSKWPDIPFDDNYTDPDETRTNRDISRDPSTESLKYRNT